ncbi:OmpA family protein [Pinibacter aurantiacus]|uniref:OmpA family protein n=1 Tax=Pinibacter aurantiacus TaxID=2851599 RepID=A0A9E2SDR7_9BACT|nr:OmpA family protein [Pinibacter aurantiacus]MBV4360252.1 OmpA family protein [Pinibacter aurantiacus]
MKRIIYVFALLVFVTFSSQLFAQVDIKPSSNDFPALLFAQNKISLSPECKRLLTDIATKLRNNPEWSAKVIGYGDDSKIRQQISWDRVNAVINYLIEKEGISGNRLIFVYGEHGPSGTVDVQITNEEGPHDVPAPHPNLRKTNH